MTPERSDLAACLRLIQSALHWSPSELADALDLPKEILVRALDRRPLDGGHQRRIARGVAALTQEPRRLRKILENLEARQILSPIQVSPAGLRSVWEAQRRDGPGVQRFKQIVTTLFKCYGLNQNQFAELCQVTPSTLKNAYRGARFTPKTERAATQALNSLIDRDGVDPLLPHLPVVYPILTPPEIIFQDERPHGTPCAPATARPKARRRTVYGTLAAILAWAALQLFSPVDHRNEDPAFRFRLRDGWSEELNPTDLWSFNGNNGLPLTNQIRRWQKNIPFAWGTKTNILEIPGWGRLSVDSKDFDGAPGDIVMHGSSSGSDSVAWICPMDGRASISGALWSPVRDPEHRTRGIRWRVSHNAQELSAGRMPGGVYSSRAPMPLARGRLRKGRWEGVEVRRGDRLYLSLERTGPLSTFVGARLEIKLTPSRPGHPAR